MDPLRISLVGLSRWEAEFVQTTVNIASGMDIAPWRLVDDPKRADVLLVDAKRNNFESANDQADGPIVVSFSTDERNDEGRGRGLTRPVGYGELISMLKAIESELKAPVIEPVPAPAPPRAEPAANRPEPSADADNSGNGSEPGAEKNGNGSEPSAEISRLDSEPSAIGDYKTRSRSSKPAESIAKRSRPARRFVEATRYLGLLREILNNGKAVEIAHALLPSVSVFPRINAFLSAEDPTAIPRMFRESAIAFSTREIADDIASATLPLSKCQPLGRLVYCAALFGSEGRLLLNSDPKDELRLVDWPDFHSVPHLAEHRTIAKFMLVNSATLPDIASSTGAGIGVVIDFCNACEAVGLVRRENADGVHVGNGGVSQLLGRVRGLFKTH